MNPSSGVFKEMQTTIPASIVPTGGAYVVTVGLGTPKKDFTLSFDTGSDLTWTQCEPCLGGCFPQNQPKFDPTTSTSYKNVSCSSEFCKLIAEGNYRILLTYSRFKNLNLHRDGEHRCVLLLVK
jgi:hypothetical protein